MKPLISVLVLASLFLAGTASAAAKTYYVSTNGLHEVNGVVWGTYTTSDGVDHDAYTNLQQVISAAANGSTIWVEDGFTVSEGSTFYRGKESSGGNDTRIVSDVWNSQLTIRSRSGDWRTGAEIRGDAITRCFGGQSDTLIGFRFVSGTTTNGAGAGALVSQYGGTFQNCLFADCSAASGGGGIGRTGPTSVLTIENCVFTNCVARNGSGGGVNGGNRSAKCRDCLFVDNRANGSLWNNGSGGGLYGDAASASNCVFVSCHAYNKEQIAHASRQNGDGGGGCALSSVMDCVFSNCTATSGGGALARCVGGKNVTIVNCQAGRGGGGIRSGKWIGGAIVGCIDTNTTASTTTNGGGANEGAVLTDFLLSGNRAIRYGGGANGCTLTNCVVVFNVASNASASSSASIAGGGIYGGRAVGCVIANNIACGPEGKKGTQYFGNGGGSCGTALVRCLVTNNIAWYMGGGAYGGSAVNCLVSDNESFAQGGGFATTTPIVNTLVARNTATSQSGVYVADKATSVLVNTTVTANENTVADKSAVIRACITNCVVWGNTGTGTLQTSTLSRPAYSCFPDADGSNGTTSSDPRLADVDGKTFVATSPRCRGDGIVLPWMLNTNDVRSLDWYGAPRSYRDRADMGWVSVKPTYFILSVQ